MSTNVQSLEKGQVFKSGKQNLMKLTKQQESCSRNTSLGTGGPRRNSYSINFYEITANTFSTLSVKFSRVEGMSMQGKKICTHG